MSAGVLEQVQQLFQQAREHQKRGETEAAFPLYRRVTEIAPGHADAWNNLGVLLADRQKLAAGAACIRRAIRLNRNSGAYHSNLGMVLWRMCRFDEAATALCQAVALEPDRREALFNLGLTYHSLGKGDEAVTAFDGALALAPEDAAYRWERALTLLANGDLRDGFAEYEIRWEAKGVAPPQFPMPLWKGEPLGGRHILVTAEQGFGDTIQYARYLPILAERGARVVFAVPAELLRLFHGFPGTVAVIDRASAMPLTNFHVPLMSLPHRLGTTLRSIPAEIPYLSVPGTLSAKLARPPGTTLAIGIAWAGRPTHEFDQRRSMSPEEFLALSDLPGVALFSLQKGERAPELAATGADALTRDLGAQLEDFAVTAAVLKELDLVVSVDTAVVHLAGAMGRTAFVLLPFVADWRWLRGRVDSPWYPTLRLFRQEKPGDWAGVMRHVRAAVEEMTAAKPRVT
jgi:Flp pilus assembly protein TadD